MELDEDELGGGFGIRVTGALGATTGLGALRAILGLGALGLGALGLGALGATLTVLFTLARLTTGFSTLAVLLTLGAGLAKEGILNAAFCTLGLPTGFVGLAAGFAGEFGLAAGLAAFGELLLLDNPQFAGVRLSLEAMLLYT
jgi:hypothetical protein